MTILSPEAAISRKQNQTLTEKEIAALRDSVAKFESERPQLENFKKIYPPEKIKSDEWYIKSTELRIKRDGTTPELEEQKFYATILEMVLEEFSSTWLPGYLTVTTRFDDLMRR